MADGWFELYSFDRMLPTFPDIVAANYICATWNQKPFVENLIFFRLTDGGRFSFLNGTARRKDDGTGEAWQIETPEAFRRYVTDDLGLGFATVGLDLDRDCASQLCEAEAGLCIPSTCAASSPAPPARAVLAVFWRSCTRS